MGKILDIMSKYASFILLNFHSENKSNISNRNNLNERVEILHFKPFCRSLSCFHLLVIPLSH